MSNKKSIKCQCPILGYVSTERESQYTKEEKSGMNHKPNKCKGTNNIKPYKRNGKKLYLCSCCYFGDDKLIK